MVTKIVRNNPTKKKIEIIRIIYTRAITKKQGSYFCTVFSALEGYSKKIFWSKKL